MRSIDADTLIDKSYWHGEMPSYDNPFPHGRDAVDVEDIENAPTVDAVPVIRCKDCKRWRKDVAGYAEFIGYCELAKWMIEKNGYCVHGERKEVQE